MIRNKYTDIVCTIIIVLSLIITVVFMNGEAFGIQKSEYTVEYENRLFNTDVVHTVDIVVDESDWQTMLDEATEEEYIKCNIVIDGESYKNVAIRPKGNSSLTQVAASDSDRYSFKIEFDHYNDSLNYYGLDKLCLNNSVQDNTYMKDFVSYQMMQEVGADGPLCSFAWITVNGQDWGLYLAVEGIEEGFAQRNYGSDYGAIYKPDNMDMNGGKPDMGEMPDLDQMKDQKPDQMPEEETSSQIPEDQSNRAEQNSISNLESQASDQSNWNEQSQAAQGAEIQSDANQNVPSSQAQDNTKASEEAQVPQMAQGRGENGKGSREFDQRGGSMNRGSDAVKLLYSDDEIDSYADIFDNTVMDVTNADKKRLIASIKQLNEGENISEVVDTDEVIRYFVAHNFVLNGDSYTGMMVHNYYLREKDGKMSMIAWDYNLAFGGMSMRKTTAGVDQATALVNSPIDSPVEDGDIDSRPMVSWIFNNEEYLNQYHSVFSEFITSYFDSGKFEQLYDKTIALISPYVEKDPTAFCTYEEFQQAAQYLKEFCILRAQSIKGQLNGSIPSTSEGQEANSSTLINASSIDIDAMGTQNEGGFGNENGGMPPFDFENGEMPSFDFENGEMPSFDFEGGEVPSFNTENSPSVLNPGSGTEIKE